MKVENEPLKVATRKIIFVFIRNDGNDRYDKFISSLNTHMLTSKKHDIE